MAHSGGSGEAADVGPVGPGPGIGPALGTAIDPGVSEGEPAAAQTPPHPLDPNGGLAPALVAPGGNDDQSRPPSYEVAIASAAASHNKALTRCTEQPQAVRTQCEQEANAAFAEAQTSLAPLRGNPE